MFYKETLCLQNYMVFYQFATLNTYFLDIKSEVNEKY